MYELKNPSQQLDSNPAESNCHKAHHRYDNPQ